MTLIISNDKLIRDLQQEFRSFYPFLKLDFYKIQNSDPALTVKKHLPESLSLRSAGLKSPGILEMNNEMTVHQFEKLFKDKFELDVQVSRKSGMLWLETTITDKWTLQKQNDHGREISLTSSEMPGFMEGNEAV